MIYFAVVLHSPGSVMPWLEEKVFVVYGHSFGMHPQESDSLVTVHEALQGRCNDCDPPIRLEAYLGEGKETSKTWCLFLKTQETLQPGRSTSLHRAGLVMASEMIIGFEG